MLIILIVLSLITIIIVLFYDKKGSIKEMEHYYRCHSTSQKQVTSKKDIEENKL